MIKLKFVFLLALAVFFKQLLWLTFIPLWQTPDEQAHYGQVNFTAKTTNYRLTGNNLSQEIYNSENILGTLRDENGNNLFTYHPEYNIPYGDYIYGPSESKITNTDLSSRVNFVKNEATNYPPLYYKLSAVADNVFSNGTILDRVFFIRILSSLTLVALVLITLYVVLEITQNEITAIGTSLLVAFHPMLSFVHAGVTSDTLFNLIFSYFLYLCIRIINRGVSISLLFNLLFVLVIGFLTKPQMNIAFFILLPVIVHQVVVNRHKLTLKYVLFFLVIVGITFQGIASRLFGGNSIFPETEGLAQNPNITILEHLSFTLKHTLNEVLPWYWGVFRWLSLGLPDPLRRLTNWLTIFSFIGFAYYICKIAIKKSNRWLLILLIFVFYSLFIYFVAITAFDFGFRQTHGFSFGIQGRYFFPVIIPQMIIFILGITIFIPSRLKTFITYILSAGMIVFNYTIFFYLVHTYYIFQFPLFFYQASQYKPLWLKFPINLIILLISLTVTLLTYFKFVTLKPLPKTES